MSRVSLGESGENAACMALRRQGYEILARRYRTRFGELDIVARDGPTLVFVEVKARSSSRFGSPAEAITPIKQRRVAMMAADYLTRRHLHGCSCRFDVVAVTASSSGVMQVQVFRNAFEGSAGLD